MPGAKVTKKPVRKTPRRRKEPIFSEEEKVAMRETIRERQRPADVDGEGEVLAKIAEMQEPDRAMAKRIHALVKASAPNLSAKTWYGMPAYATKDGKVVCFFQSGLKFKTRYATLGFQPGAQLDEGTMWPTSWALTSLTSADEKRIATLVKKAARAGARRT